MKITKEEIAAVSELNAFARYQYFIKRVADTEKMYSLIDTDGNYAIADIEGRAVISFWSAPEYALLNITGNWFNYSIKELTIEAFEDELIDQIEENDWLLNIFSVKGKSGFVVDLNEFAKDLSEEMKKYH